MFKWFGLFISLAVWAGLALLLLRWRDRKLGSISAHGSTNSAAAWLFKILLIGGGLLYYWWLVGWFVPHLSLPVIFTVLLTVVIIYQIATGLNNGGRDFRKDVHEYTSKTMFLLYIPLAILILAASNLPLTARIIDTMLAAYLITSYVLVEVMKRFRQHYLIVELLHIVVFQLVILASAYL